jgi:DNA-directed RNA polymerase specialized sigma24 family protein
VVEIGLEKTLVGESAASADVEAFVKDAGPGVKQALIASFGGEMGREATAEALSYAWANWSRIQGMDNPSGYVYQVGRNWARKTKRRQARRFRSEAAAAWSPGHHEIPLVEPGLLPAVGNLSEPQRIATVLVYGFGWRLTEVAELMGLSVGSVQKHSERGLSKLRRALGVEVDVKR